jgi:hypothetical protein
MSSEIPAFTAVITDIRLETPAGAAPARWQMTLSDTPLAAGDTGTLEATSPKGTKIEVPILAVIDEDGDLWHAVEKPLAAGTDVKIHRSIP